MQHAHVAEVRVAEADRRRRVVTQQAGDLCRRLAAGQAGRRRRQRLLVSVTVEQDAQQDDQRSRDAAGRQDRGRHSTRWRRYLPTGGADRREGNRRGGRHGSRTQWRFGHDLTVALGEQPQERHPRRNHGVGRHIEQHGQTSLLPWGEGQQGRTECQPGRVNVAGAQDKLVGRSSGVGDQRGEGGLRAGGNRWVGAFEGQGCARAHGVCAKRNEVASRIGISTARGPSSTATHVQSTGSMAQRPSSAPLALHPSVNTGCSQGSPGAAGTTEVLASFRSSSW